MGSGYTINNPDGVYFVTFTTVQWVDVFTRSNYFEILIDSLKYCQENKGLSIHAWTIMSNHLHLIISKKGKESLSGIIRDFKKYTSVKIINAIMEENESRRNWIKWIFNSAGVHNPNNKYFQLWQQDSHPEEIINDVFFNQKLTYIHNNIIKTGIVEKPEDYRYSSARDYLGITGLIKIDFPE